MNRALLIGADPHLGHRYVREPPYDGVVIGSLDLGQLLCFQEEAVLQALAQGKRVELYAPGLPQVTGNRALAASVSEATRKLKAWGIVFTEGQSRQLICEQAAREMKARGELPAAGAVLTPSAREILEG